MRASTGGRPQDLGLGGVQLEPVGSHPACNIINAAGNSVLQLQWRRRFTELIYLCVVGVQMWVEAVTLDKWNEVSSVQQEENVAEERSLRYTNTIQCGTISAGDEADDPVRIRTSAGLPGMSRTTVAPSRTARMRFLLLAAESRCRDPPCWKLRTNPATPVQISYRHQRRVECLNESSMDATQRQRFVEQVGQKWSKDVDIGFELCSRQRIKCTAFVRQHTNYRNDFVDGHGLELTERSVSTA